MSNDNSWDFSWASSEEVVSSAADNFQSPNWFDGALKDIGDVFEGAGKFAADTVKAITKVPGEAAKGLLSGMNAPEITDTAVVSNKNPPPEADKGLLEGMMEATGKYLTSEGFSKDVIGGIGAMAKDRADRKAADKLAKQTRRREYINKFKRPSGGFGVAR